MVRGATHKRTWRSTAARELCNRTSSASVEYAVLEIVSTLLDNVRCPPTDLAAVCEKLKVPVIESDDLVGSGALVEQNGEFQIIYAPGLSPQRRRFTIAHEIGHLIVERSSQNGVRQSGELERLCDVFATELLMPTSTFTEIVGPTFRLRDLPSLAKNFQVSLTSAAIRLAEVKRVSVFEVSENRIAWGVGIVRRGSIGRLDDSFREPIAKALAGQAGSDKAYININESIRRCEIEYLPFGKTQRALVLVRALPMP
jgi:Zn-dependent peptidase ImmA (M78 family)